MSRMKYLSSPKNRAQSDEPSGTLCEKCRITFEPSHEVFPDDIIFLDLPFHSQAWEISTRRRRPNNCVFCTFLSALVSLKVSGGAPSTSKWSFIQFAKYQTPRLVTREYTDPHEGHQLYQMDIEWTQYRFHPFNKSLIPIPESLALFELDDPRIKGASIINMTSKNTASQQSFDTLAFWIENCAKNHASCKQLGQKLKEDASSWRPTRLVHITFATETTPCTIKLVERLDSSESNRLRYATLSYCWGIAPFTKLVKSNLVNFKSGIDISTLPKTFQDCIAAAEKLGIEYCWIDALCIVQDSEEDWARESTMMAKVYSYSSLTLAAAASTESNGGLFCDRDPVALNGAKMKLNWGDAKGEFNCIRHDPWIDYVRDSPLLKRAWVFQERLLSPRTVYFAQDQLYWECGGLYASEAFPQGGPWDLEFRPRAHDTATRVPPGLEPANDGRFKHNYYSIILPGSEQPDMNLTDMIPYLWSNIISEYSSGNLTFESDKLVAILGVATNLAELIGDDTYIAGLWKSNLALELLWSRAGPEGRTHDYQAPSWSWASMGTKVGMDLLFRCVEPPEVKIKIFNIDVDIANEPGTTGNINKGILRIKGRLCKAFQTSRPLLKATGPLSSSFWDRSTFGKYYTYTLVPFYRLYGLGFSAKGLMTTYGTGRHVFDEEGKTYKNLVCLEVATGKTNVSHWDGDFVSGLLLCPTGIKGQFSRVGFFELFPKALRRSWQAGGRTRAMKKKNQKDMVESLFTDSNIEPRFYEQVEGDEYTISIV